MGEESLLRSRGVNLEVLQDATCVDLMRRFIVSKPELLERGHRRGSLAR